MANWLKNLRKKPKHVRENVAFGTSFGFTLVIALIWFMQGGSTHLATDTTKADPGFFKTFKEGFSKQVAAVRESLPKQTASTTPAAVDRSNFQATPFGTTTSASSSEQKPVLIEIIHASGTASSSSSSSGY